MIQQVEITLSPKSRGFHLGLTKMNKDVMFTNGWRTPGSIRNSCLMLTIGYKCDL